MDTIEEIEHNGSCHCGQIKFKITAPKKVILEDCDCSICYRTGYLHLYVPQNKLIIQGEENLIKYQFGTNKATHMFCKICGIKSFYIPRSDPTSYSVNFRCLDQSTFESYTIKAFDGKNY